MRIRWLSFGVVFPFLLAHPVAMPAQAGAASQQPYTMQVAVDEVEVIFNATDKHGLPVSDLKPDEVKVLDNLKAPRRILSFESLNNRPIRAALLLDTSTSMEKPLATSKLVAEQFAQHILRKTSDQAMVMDFGYSSEFLQNWTGDPTALSRSIQSIGIGKMNPLPGTAILDAIFRTCFYGLSKADPDATVNIILLFSDGEDNAGQVTKEDALRACQRSNTVIYSFRFPTSPDHVSTGPGSCRILPTQPAARCFPPTIRQKPYGVS